MVALIVNLVYNLLNLIIVFNVYLADENANKTRTPKRDSSL